MKRKKTYRSLKGVIILILFTMLTLGVGCGGSGGDEGGTTTDPEPTLSSAKDITSFIFSASDTVLSTDAIGIINGTNISVSVPFGTDLDGMAPTILISASATIDPQSGVAPLGSFSDGVSKVYKVTAQDGSTKDYNVTVNISKTSDKAITSFSFNGLTPVVNGVIDENNHTITLTVPYDTSLLNLIPTITFSGNIIDPASGVGQDFNTPKTYTVTAQDGSTQDYQATVNVAAVSTEKAITVFRFNGLTPVVNGVIDENNHTITLTVPYGTSVVDLVPTITVSNFASVDPASGVEHAFVDGAPETYTVTAQDGTTQQAYAVTVNVTPPRTGTDIVTLTIPQQIDGSTINDSTHVGEIDVTVSTDLTNVAPIITVSDGAAISPVSGTARDFSSGSASYTVTAEDNSLFQTWTVYVSHGGYDLRSETTNFTFNTNLGTAGKDVYFVFTNTNMGSSTSMPVVSNKFIKDANELNIDNLIRRNNDVMQTIGNKPLGINGKPEISEFNRDPFGALKITPIISEGLKNIFVQPPQKDSVNETYSFYNDSTSNTIPATCRKVVSSIPTDMGNKTLNIWVANDSWYAGGTKTNLITQNMVDAMANSFLKSGDNNDIYDWMSGIFGGEWGAHSYGSQLIGADNEITILLYDIDDDNSTSGGTLGYFWSKDTFLASEIDYSNERLVFYIDSVMFAHPENTYGDGDVTWELTDFWPQKLIGTLAHEFQHMIHLYQKAILLTGGTNSETWINEMCSMVSEDLVANNLAINGPRAVAYNDSSAGSANNQDGRLPLYNYYNDFALAAWATGTDALKSYAINYAFGAYLARNHGGAQFFRNVVQNTSTDYQAIEYALTQAGSSDSFFDSMRKWAIANLFSNIESVETPYRYNNGSSWMTDPLGYNIGSINLYNYRYNGEDGPYIYTSFPSWEMYQSSNLYFRAGTNVTGTQSWDIDITSDHRVTIVIKDHE